VKQFGEPAVLAIHLDQGGKLRLPARSAMIDNQLLRRAPCDIFTKIFTDQR
jgi:hypothetical protein